MRCWRAGRCLGSPREPPLAEPASLLPRFRSCTCCSVDPSSSLTSCSILKSGHSLSFPLGLQATRLQSHSPAQGVLLPWCGSPSAIISSHRTSVPWSLYSGCQQRSQGALVGYAAPRSGMGSAQGHWARAWRSWWRGGLPGMLLDLMWLGLRLSTCWPLLVL